MKTVNNIVRTGGNSWLSLLGFFVGLIAISMGIKLFMDFRSINQSGSSSETNSGYLVVNKQLNLLSSFNESSGRFSEEEIHVLNEKDWVLASDGFISNNYRATLSSKQFNFSTELFFESIGEEFIDGQFESFKWDVNQDLVPVVLSNQFYNLYNFGFASGQGLPKVSKGMLKEFVFDLRVSGNGKSRKMKMKIIGFSDRISSVLVPQEFNKWANGYFGEGNPAISRMMIKVKDISDSNLESNLTALNLEVNKELLGGKVVGRIANVASMLVSSFGLFVLILSVLNFVYLVRYKISKTKQQRKILFLIGYSEKQLIVSYLKPILVQISLVTGMVVFVFLLINHQTKSFYYQLGLYVESRLVIPVLSVIVLSGTLIFWIKTILKKEFKS